MLYHHPTRQGVGYFGAVRLRDAKFVFCREEDKFNAETFFAFLKYLRKINAPARRRAILIIDNVRYHHARLHPKWRELCADRFALEFMAPYSPELNPIERIWKLTRRQVIHNRYFTTIAEVIEVVENLFAQWRLGNETLRRLCPIT